MVRQRKGQASKSVVRRRVNTGTGFGSWGKGKMVRNIGVGVGVGVREGEGSCEQLDGRERKQEDAVDHEGGHEAGHAPRAW